jgi:PhnB protein
LHQRFHDAKIQPPASASRFAELSFNRVQTFEVLDRGKQMNREDQFIPHVFVIDGLAAMDFYKQVFNAAEGDRMMAPDGQRLMHGEVVLDGHKLFISHEFSEREGGSGKTPQTLGGTSVRIKLNVDDADAVIERAVARAARVQMPVQNMFWGARYGKFIDPFGHEWGVNQQLREPTQEATEAAAAEFFAKRG